VVGSTPLATRDFFSPFPMGAFPQRGCADANARFAISLL
jgi:hypothetical protein